HPSCGGCSARGLDRVRVLPCLELQSALAGGISDGRDAAVIHESAAIEDDLRNARGLRAVGKELADLRGRVLVAGGTAAQACFGGGGGRKRLSGNVVDDLRGDVVVRAEHREARTLRGAAHLLAHAAMTPQPQLANLLCTRHDLLPGLSGLALDALAGVAHAL